MGIFCDRVQAFLLKLYPIIARSIDQVTRRYFTSHKYSVYLVLIMAGRNFVLNLVYNYGIYYQGEAQEVILYISKCHSYSMLHCI